MVECVGRTTVVFDKTLTEYDFGPHHPMSPLRVDLTMRLVEELGLFEDGGWVKAGKTTIQRTKDKGSNIYLVWTSTEPTTHSVSDEGPEGSFPGGEGLYEAQLVKQNERWVLAWLGRNPR